MSPYKAKPEARGKFYEWLILHPEDSPLKICKELGVTYPTARKWKIAWIERKIEEKVPKLPKMGLKGVAVKAKETGVEDDTFNMAEYLSRDKRIVADKLMNLIKETDKPNFKLIELYCRLIGVFSEEKVKKEVEFKDANSIREFINKHGANKSGEGAGVREVQRGGAVLHRDVLPDTGQSGENDVPLPVMGLPEAVVEDSIRPQ